MKPVEPVTKRLSFLVNSGFWMMDFGLFTPIQNSESKIQNCFSVEGKFTGREAAELPV
jgi:hypothetical protein